MMTWRSVAVAREFEGVMSGRLGLVRRTYHTKRELFGAVGSVLRRTVRWWVRERWCYGISKCLCGIRRELGLDVISMLCVISGGV